MSATGTVAEALVGAAATGRGAQVVEHDGQSQPLSYAALLTDALAVAGALRARGLSTGNRVAIVMPDVADFVRAFFGIAAGGFIPVPLCPPQHAGDLPTFARQSRHLLQASRANAVVASSGVVPLLDVAGLTGLLVETMPALRQGPALDQPVTVPVDSAALLQFTSGSTAAPRGVVLTHANLDANIRAIGGPDGIGTREGDIGVSWLPLYHDMGLIGMLLSAVYARADIVLMSPILFLKRPTAWLEAIAHSRGTVSFAPNFAYELCVRRVKAAQVERLDLSTWRIAGCGAEPVRPETLRAFAEHFAPAGFQASSFVASYGLAEHTLAVSLARGGIGEDIVDAARLEREAIAAPCASASARTVHLAACGRALPGHELRIVGEHGETQPERRVGAIEVRGPSMMRGYFEDADATAEALRDGWLQTGDVGYLADGQLFVCGRTKDLIIRQGRKYYPPDLEWTIADLLAVRPSSVVVFGVSRVGDADRVVAVVELRASLASGDIVERVKRRLRETAGLELDAVAVTAPGTVPRTTSGKVRRGETRDRFVAGVYSPPL